VKITKSTYLKILLLLILPVTSLLLSLMYGDVYIPPQEILHPSQIYRLILYEIRLPTIITAALIGIILSVSGSIMQHLLRNPLIDPYIAGTSSGGAFGAILSYFLLGFSLPLSVMIYAQPLIAFFFSFLATIITVLIGRGRGIYGLVIAGVIVSYIFSSAYSILLVLLQERYPQIPPIIFWLMGQITVVGWSLIPALTTLTLVLLILAYKMSRALDLVSISDEISYTHGIRPNRFRIFWLGLISFVVSFTISIAGVIGFIGILVPHLIRLSIGGNMRTLLVYSSGIGITVMLLSNIIADGMLGTIIPITPILAVIASPFLILFLVRRNDSEGA